MKLTKKEFKSLKSKLSYEAKQVWDKLDNGGRDNTMKLGEEYRKFLSIAKTERIAARLIAEMAAKAGLSDIDGPALKKKAKGFYRIFRKKTAVLFVPGSEPISKGMNIVASHLDSPRLDLKGHPLFEDLGLAFFRTHYYGGIKKYQWVARPFALHGVVVKANGDIVDINIGDEPGDPVLTVQDLLIHLAREIQMNKKAVEAVPGEKLTLLVGGLPLIADEDAKGRVSMGILKILNDKYGIVEEDLVSAELSAVPAGPCLDVGLDKAFLGGYGHDDRICAFASLKALLGADIRRRPAMAVFYDKEEIGSKGETGAQSRFMMETIHDILQRQGADDSESAVRRVMIQSNAISADVTSGIDPNWPEVHEKSNAARLGYGICLTKFTGSGGKIDASDASAEYLGHIRAIFNRREVPWQSAEMGKVDEGGGGTVAKFLAEHGVQVLDAGPPVLSMHSPFEIIHKGDLYSCYLAYKAFLEEA